MEFEITEDGNKNKCQMEIDLKAMEFRKPNNKDDPSQQFWFQSVEHLDSSQLKYFIKEKDVIFVRHGESAYVQAGLQGFEQEDQIGNGDGYIDSELSLYEVSESKSEKLD